ncbi:MAG: hypothetical protein IKG93_00285 [Clostridiales bacterium]|nr:hypothetical protein [Clostridiales bacterium]
MKKKTFWAFIVIIVLLVVALFPYSITKQESGNKVYKSLVYELTIYHEKINDTEYYKEGYSLSCFGKEITNSTSQGGL